MAVQSCVLIIALTFAVSQENRRAADAQVGPVSQRPPVNYDQSKTAKWAEKQTARLNNLAGRIRSESDAVALVTGLAEMFKEQLPPAWATQDVLHRVAKAEYKGVSDPSSLIPEDRIADVWNEYVRQIGAPDEALVTPAEVHNIRDAEYATGLLAPTVGLSHTVWTMPNIVAVGEDGSIAAGARALEAVRVLAIMNSDFENILSARQRVRSGVLPSTQARKILENPAKRRSVQARLTTITKAEEPVRAAERQFVEKHGVAEFNVLLQRLVNQLFPE